MEKKRSKVDKIKVVIEIIIWLVSIVLGNRLLFNVVLESCLNIIWFFFVSWIVFCKLRWSFWLLVINEENLWLKILNWGRVVLIGLGNVELVVMVFKLLKEK